MQIWVPDVRAAGFDAAAHARSVAVAVAVANSEHEAGDQAFIDAISAGDEE